MAAESTLGVIFLLILIFWLPPLAFAVIQGREQRGQNQSHRLHL